MGRGRGKGKRLTAVPNLDDPGNGGEEVVPTYKRRGRPQKPMKDDLDEEVAEKIELEEEDDMSNKDVKSPKVEFGKKRKRFLQAKEKSEPSLEENGAGAWPKVDDSSRPIVSKQTGNRRKSTPRRAAGAGVKCLFD